LEPYKLAIRPVAPFAFSAHLDNFTLPGRPSPAVWLRDEKLLRMAVPTSRGLAGVEAAFRGEPWEPVVEVTVYAGGRDVAAEASRIIGSIVRSDLDYGDFMARVSRVDRRLHMLALKHAGLRPGRCTSLYAALTDSIVKQRLALRAALRIYSRLVEDCGSRLRLAGRTFYWHPDPGRLVGLGVEGLRRYGLTRAKARALVEVASAELEGRLPGVDEAVRDPERVVGELEKLYGVGPWTARLAVVMVHPLFPLGPYSDLAVRRGLHRILGIPLSEAETVARRIVGEIPEYGGLILYLVAYEYELSKHGGGRRG